MIDSHHHLWKYTPDQYDWIDPSSILASDFDADDLRLVAEDNDIDGFVVVQARESTIENDALLAIAGRCDLIRGIVGWAPFLQADVNDVIDRYADQPLIKGYRYVVQSHEDDFLSRADFVRGIAALADTDLTYDLLIQARQLPAAIELVDRFADVKFVIDHIAKPTIARGQIDRRWHDGITQIARRDNVMCKFSGVATEIPHAAWSIDDIRPYWDVTLDRFTPDRILFGSDWPVCLLQTEYTQWLTAVRRLGSELSGEDQAKIFGGNATRFYRL